MIRERLTALPAHEVIELCVNALQDLEDKEEALRAALTWQEHREEVATEPNARIAKRRLVRQFVDERCVLREGASETARRLFNAYYAWFEAIGAYCPPTNNLSYCLRKLGVERDYAHKTREGCPFVGVALID
jgi:hypothetical protein